MPKAPVAKQSGDKKVLKGTSPIVKATKMTQGKKDASKVVQVATSSSSSSSSGSGSSSSESDSDASSSSSSSSSPAPLPAPTSPLKYIPALQQALIQSQSLASHLPAGSELSFQRTMDRNVAKGLDGISKQLLGLAGKLIDLAEKNEDLKGQGKGKVVVGAGGKGKGKGKERFEDLEDLVDGEAFHNNVSETLDKLLEAADVHLDQHMGRVKSSQISIPSSAPINKPTKLKPIASDHTPTSRLPEHLLRSIMSKSQTLFPPSVAVNNFPPTGPSWKLEQGFKKYHSMVPLGWELQENSEEWKGLLRILGGHEERIPTTQEFVHPYTYEMIHYQPPSSLFIPSEPKRSSGLSNTPFTFVSTPSQLEEMITKLEAATEIAVDLEHHSWRSYYGFVCLMQISTREEDWVVDTLSLRKELREGKLKGVMADPEKIKVFHGAESDIIWLQENFGIFVVGLFDTFHASKVLEFPSHSLSTLLSLYCDFTPDKRYQMADWRIRPLPEEFLHYARTDTHYLLFIYDHLRNALLDRSSGSQTLVREVLTRSAGTALKLHSNTDYDMERGTGLSGWKNPLLKALGRKSNAVTYADFGGKGDKLTWGFGEAGLIKERIYKRIHAWRDLTAKEEDESVHYVLHSQLIMTLAIAAPTDLLALNRKLEGQNEKHRFRGPALLKVITDAIQEVKDAQEASATPASVEATSEVPVAVTGVAEDSVIALETVEEPIVKSPLLRDPREVWATTATPSTTTKRTSSLFGKALPSTPSSTKAAPKSSLFGKTINKPTATAAKKNAKKEAALKKVMKSLQATIATVAVAAEPMDVDTKSPAAAEEVPAPAPTIPEQVPYVKPSERTTLAPKVKKEKEKDEIVTVGRSKASQKRKVPPIDATASSSTSTGEIKDQDVASSSSPVAAKKQKVKTPIKSEEIPTFSYATEPNQLDSFKAEAPGRLKKPKKVKKPIVDTSNFRKPPMDPSNVAAGSRSMTF